MSLHPSGAQPANYIVTPGSTLHTRRVLDLGPFKNLRLRGGFTLAEIRLTAQPLLDPLDRAAIAETTIRGI
jgi:hypothetical protein